MGCLGVLAGPAPLVGAPRCGVTGTRPASLPPAAAWERGAGARTRLPAQPSIPRARSLHTAEGTMSPAPPYPAPGGTPRVTARRGGEVGAGGTAPPRRSRLPAGSQPVPSLPKSSSAGTPLPPELPPRPDTPCGDRQRRTPSTGAQQPPAPSRPGCHAWPPPPEQMPPPAAPPHAPSPGRALGPPCPRRPPLPCS